MGRHVFEFESVIHELSNEPSFHRHLADFNPAVLTSLSISCAINGYDSALICNYFSTLGVPFAVAKLASQRIVEYIFTLVEEALPNVSVIMLSRARSTVLPGYSFFLDL